jgi:hypothetical protein
MHWADFLYPAELHAAQLTVVPEIDGVMVEAGYGHASSVRSECYGVGTFI